jgi:glucokinase
MLIGLDVGGTFLKGARLGDSGAVDERVHQPIAKATPQEFLDQIEATVRTLQAGTSVAGVGIGLPGIVDRAASRVRVSPAVPVLDGLSIGEEIARRTGVPVFLENDANAAALGETWLGAGRGARDVLLVTLGTGIGAGLVLGGRVWSGKSGYAGEIGHIQVDPDGVPCPCGSRGCLETIAGAKGWTRAAESLIASRASSLKGKDLDQRAIVDAAREGDAVALEVVERAARALGMGIAAVLDLLNLERVVLAGGVAAAGPFFLDKIVEETRRRTYPQVFADGSFRVAELGGDAGVVGAARVAMTALLSGG